MKDKEKSTLALYFVWAAYRLMHETGPFKLELYSGHGAQQIFAYHSCADLEEDLEIISAWIGSKEIG